MFLIAGFAYINITGRVIVAAILYRRGYGLAVEVKTITLN